MSRTFIIITLSIFVIVGAAFFLVLRWGSELPAALPAAAPGAAPPPPPPSVSVTEENSHSGNLIYVQWTNLPGGATELEIFRSPKGKNQWTLWKTVDLTGLDLADGSFSFDIGNYDYSTYDFYTEVLGTGGNGGTVTTTSTLWTSNPSPPGVTTSTPPAPPPPGNGNSTGTENNSTGTQNPPPPPPPPPGNSSSSTSTPPAPSGTPYYNPQVQVSSYGQNPSANFWVQHLDQTIQMGWQNIPPITTSIVISRSASGDGPWTPLLTQANPAQSGSYTLQIADNTVSEPYYYELDAYAGTTIVATYGPVFLPPLGQ